MSGRKLSAIEACIVERFTNLYGPVNASNPNKLIAEYGRAFNGTELKLFNEALDLAIDAQDVHAWPTIGSIKKALKVVCEKRAADWAREREPDMTNWTPATPEMKARIDALLKDATAKLKDAQPPAHDPRKPDWARGQKPAWEERLRTSNTARHFAGLPLIPGLKW